jgi:hypothetical protein
MRLAREFDMSFPKHRDYHMRWRLDQSTLHCIDMHAFRFFFAVRRSSTRLTGGNKRINLDSRKFSGDEGKKQMA